MHKDKCIIILNIPAQNLQQALSLLTQSFIITRSLKETTSVFKDGVLISQAFSKQQVLDIIKRIHFKKIEESYIYAFSYTDISKADSKTPTTDYKPLERANFNSLVCWQDDIRNESLIVCNDESVTVYENSRNGAIKDVFKTKGLFCASSRSGIFMAVCTAENVKVFGNGEVYGEFNYQNVKSLYFSDNDTYLMIEYKSGGDITCVANLVTGKIVFEGRIGKNRIVFTRDEMFFYLENTNQIFKKTSQGENDTSKILFGRDKGYVEAFSIQEEFAGIKTDDIEVFCEYNGLYAILTNEKIKNIIIIKDGQVVRKKNYINLEEARFVKAESRLFALIDKRVGERNVFSVESFDSQGDVTYNNVEKKIVDISVSDTSFTLFTAENEVLFYGLSSKFTLLGQVKKTHRVILSTHKKGNVNVIYDYEKDSIEFYDKGQPVNKYSHPGCTNINWSFSGLYCCSSSLGAGMSGMVQVFDVNGVFLWKRVFNKLVMIEWRSLLMLKSLEEDVKKDYSNMVEEIENEDEDLKMEYEKRKKENYDDMIAMWKDFLIQRKNEVEEFKNKA